MNDLKYIKDHYGEKMAQLCRDLFPTILETPGELSRIMGECFYPAKYLYYDIVSHKLIDEFEEFINSKINKKEKILLETEKDPFELMEDAGYELYECKTEEEIQVFRKYYDKRGQKYDMCRNEIPRHVGEELCTFDGGRLESCHVFFAVKKEAEKLKREEFKNPMREDEYGTSVISIQFSRYNYRLSIKNRYNHTVDNPDATFENNLENIIPGLTKSFEEYYGREIKQSDEDDFEIPDYIELDGKFYKYNYEINNIYYCPNNIIIENGKIRPYPSEQYIIMDYYVLDLKNKTITLFDSEIDDGLIEEYKDIKDIEIKKEENQKKLIITKQDGKKSIITINNQNQIIGYENSNMKKMPDDFMSESENLKELSLPKLKEMGSGCFYQNKGLKELSLPNLEAMGDKCFRSNKIIEKLFLPKLKIMNRGCFVENEHLVELSLPKLKTMGSSCFNYNKKIENLSLPVLETMDGFCFEYNKSLKELSLPILKSMGRSCFDHNYEICSLHLPNLETIGEQCFTHNKELKELSLPKLKEMSLGCFNRNESIEKLELPSLEVIGYGCFQYNIKLTELSLPKLKEMEAKCFFINKNIKKLHSPVLKRMEEQCFVLNARIEVLSLPNLVFMGDHCFYYADAIEKLHLPELSIMKGNCFEETKKIESLNLPNLKIIGANCFDKAPLKNIIAPNLSTCGSTKIQELIEQTRKKGR